jgi:chemotaxis protein histidine kinase CheA
VRAIAAQPSRQLSTLRPITSRVTLLDSAKPSLYRSFHQTRIWRAEEEEKKAEELKDEAASAATAAEEAAEVAQEAADEAVVQAAAEPAAAPAAQEAIDVSSSATAAAQTAAAAASTAQSAAAAAAPSPSQPPQRSAEFPPRQATPSSFANPSPTPILYIGNLFFEVTVQQLEQEFSRYGRIVNTRIVSDARGLSKGFGYVEFESQEAADRAVRELDQKVFQGRRMAVQYHVRREPRNRTVGGTGRTPNTPSKTLFIGNMSYQMSDRDLNGKRAWPTIYT